MLAVLIWDKVSVNVSVEVAGDAGMDGVSDDEAWSKVEWFVAKERDWHKDLCAGPFLMDGFSVVVETFDRL